MTSESQSTCKRRLSSGILVSGLISCLVILSCRSVPKRSLSELNVALLRAASSGDVVLAESLINEGVNPNTTNIDGVTPLMIAAGTGQTAVVDLLLKKGAQPELQTRRDGVTALMFAADGGHRAVIESLLNGSAKVRTKDKGERGH